MADLFKYVQAQNFSLAGAGAIAGATSITLKSFVGIDGALLTMSDFGSIGFGTLQPGEGTSEEQISWTGVVQNANGTATLTGVSSVLFISPYTAASGLAKTHAGSTIFIVSNTSGFYDRLTSKSDDETISGLWNFPSGANNPTIGTVYVAPTIDIQIATKGYVDSVAFGVGVLATDTTFGYVKLSVAAANPLQPIVVGTNDTRVPPINTSTMTSGQVAGLIATTAPGASNLYMTQKDFQKSAEIYGASATGNDTYVVTLSPALAAYLSGFHLFVKVDVGNTGAATINVNGLGAVSIVTGLATALVTGDMVANGIYELIYNSTGAVFQLVNPSSTVVSRGQWKTLSTTHDMSSTTTTVIAHGLPAAPTFVRAIVNRETTSTNTLNQAMPLSIGSFDGTNQRCDFVSISTNGATVASSIDATHTIHYGFGGSAGADNDNLVGAISVDATNITITWTKTGSPTGTGNIILEAFY